MGFSKPTPAMVQHMRPLYITADVNDIKVSKIMVDTGAAVNILTTRTMHLLGIKKEKIQSTFLTLKNFAGTITKTLGLIFLQVKVGLAEGVYAFFVTDCYAAYSVILGRDWIHRSYCVPSILHQELIIWDRVADKEEIVKADPRLFWCPPATWTQVRKKNGKMRVCVDYRDLNKATPKDVYPKPVADMLVDAVAGHELLSFMDGTSSYHQIPVAEEDRHKTAFRCPGFAGVFEYVVMPFSLKNAGATY
ncbi:uncharacterized protein LOC112199358 [Rosa chinensis]|uniref:uncharacterized protein LOC112199358 n=1 Tax=Rosa chinensis TaxID=74649 RepID=UPI000D095D58|nr:uncharacterized protein LOC112199358 [Rosa chinensis]